MKRNILQFGPGRTLKLMFWIISGCYCYAKEKDPTTQEYFERLVDWIRSHGGRVDSRFGVGMKTHNGEEVRGIVALEDMEEGSELLFCPWELVMGGAPNIPKDNCALLEDYASNVRAGEKSFWYPYLKMDDSLSTRIPTLWSPEAIQETQGLPPFDRIDTEFPSLTDWFSKTCAGGTPFEDLDNAVRQALLAAVTRAAGMRFLPLLDLFNHHNGLLNTRSSATTSGNTLTATHKIMAGEEIFHSYRGGAEGTTSELFRRYGFIESWPQQYALNDPETGDGIRFLLVGESAEIVILYPPESLTSLIGASKLTGDILQTAGAQRHNEALSMEQLAGYCSSARHILNALPTTLEEDEAILAKLESEAKKKPSRKEKHTSQDFLLDDRIHAIKYRMHLKQALSMSLNVAESALLHQQQETKMKEEL